MGRDTGCAAGGTGGERRAEAAAEAAAESLPAADWMTLGARDRPLRFAAGDNSVDCLDSRASSFPLERAVRWSVVELRLRLRLRWMSVAIDSARGRPMDGAACSPHPPLYQPRPLPRVPPPPALEASLLNSQHQIHPRMR